MLIRASLDALIALGMVKAKMVCKSSTAYLLQYSAHGCLASCSYCSQARTSKSKKDVLGRILWPTVELIEVASRINDRFRRVCIQTVLKRTS